MYHIDIVITSDISCRNDATKYDFCDRKQQNLRFELHFTIQPSNINAALCHTSTYSTQTHHKIVEKHKDYSIAQSIMCNPICQCGGNCFGR